MLTNPKHSYLDPTYPAYYWDFNRSNTFLFFSLRRFVLILTIFDIIFSSLAVTFGLSYLIIDQLSQINLFQSNGFIQQLTHLPIGIFVDNRIIFRPFWTIQSISENLPVIFYLHNILNSLSLYCSINMYAAIVYNKPNRGIEIIEYFILNFF